MMNWRVKTRRGKLDLGDTRAVWARFGRYAALYRWHLFGALGAAVGATAVQIAAPWPIKVVFDYVLTDNMSPSSWFTAVLDRVTSGPTSALGWVCGAVLLLAALDAVFAHLRDVMLATTGQRIVGRIRQDLFAHLQTLPPPAFERRQTGDLLMRLTGDILMLRQMLVGSLVTGCQSALMICAALAMMFWLDPVLALLGVAAAPLVALASYRISGQIRKAAKGQREKESEVAGIAHDVLGAMDVVQAFNREPIEQKRFARQNRSSVRAGVKTTRLESKLYRIVSLGSAVGMCAILYVGVRSVLGGRMTPGDLLVFVAYLRALNKPIRNLAKLTGQVAKATSCGQRVAEIFAIEPEVRNRPGARALDRPTGAISFDRVTFRYADGTEALSEVSIELAAGQRVAVVGHTGAGKTTLFKLLLRFCEPQAGCVRIDGLDLGDITLESLRGHIGWVHQDTVLFGMSVAQNIALGRADAPREMILDVGRRVRVDEFVSDLPEGYDTVLGRNGTTISGGQRQRIALARALLREAPILLLDEPATGLDPITRRLVEEAWMSDTNTATTLVICHRTHDMERFDRIVVLARGRVVATGSHSELLGTSPHYAALISASAAFSVTTDSRLAPGKLAC